MALASVSPISVLSEFGRQVVVADLLGMAFFVGLLRSIPLPTVIPSLCALAGALGPIRLKGAASAHQLWMPPPWLLRNRLSAGSARDRLGLLHRRLLSNDPMPKSVLPIPAALNPVERDAPELAMHRLGRQGRWQKSAGRYPAWPARAHAGRPCHHGSPGPAHSRPQRGWRRDTGRVSISRKLDSFGA